MPKNRAPGIGPYRMGTRERSPTLRILFRKPVGEWKASLSVALKQGLPNAYFRSLGLPELTVRRGL